MGTPLLILVSVCLGLLPAAAEAQFQGSVGPLEPSFGLGGDVTDSARAGSLAFFTILSPPDPYEPAYHRLVRSNGTWGGTFSIDPRGPVMPDSVAPIRFADSLGSLLFFTSALHSAPQDRGLWRSDGTVAGTFAVAQELNLALDINAAESPVTLTIPERSLMFFSASPRPGSPDFELWVTDGTAAGTRLLKDVNPEGSSNPRRMTAFGGRLFFFADTPQGRELWRSDGTVDGTERVHDFHDSPATPELLQAGGALFVLERIAEGLDVWRSDGTEAGTARVLAVPQRLFAHRAAGRNLFLVTQGDQGHEMWAVDGSTGDAIRVLQFESSHEIRLLAVGNHVAFALEDDHGMEPWWSDGTPQGTHRIADICPGPCSSLPFFASLVRSYRGRAVFWADDGVSGTEVWLTDGTAAGTWRLADTCPGECGGFPDVEEINGWLALLNGSDLWISDGTRDGAWSFGSVYRNTMTAMLPIPGRLLLFTPYLTARASMTSLPVTAPAPQPGAWLESASAPGFRFKVQIGQTAGRREPACMARTLCVSGAVPGQPEVFLRLSEPKTDGRIWPSMVKLTPAPVDVWVLQTATGYLRHYRLNGAGSGSILSGTLDREGFLSVAEAQELAFEEAKARKNPQPPGRWIEAKGAPGFRVQARLTSGGKKQILRKEPCVAGTFCLSGATPGTTEVLVRVPGPMPNGYFWPMVARFAPATLEVWVQQRKTGKIRYYRLNAPPAGSPQLDGYVDRQGFKK